MTIDQLEDLRAQGYTIVGLERDKHGNRTGKAHVVGDPQDRPMYTCDPADYVAVTMTPHPAEAPVAMRFVSPTRKPACWEDYDADRAARMADNGWTMEFSYLRPDPELTALRAEVERLRGALGAVRMLRNLGGMMPGVREVVMVAVEAADAALEGK